MNQNLMEARALIREYGDYVQEQNLDGIMNALSDDASLYIPQRSAIDGKNAIVEFYETCFRERSYSVDLNITDEKIVAEVVFINGYMTRTLKSATADPQTKLSYFTFILRQEPDRHLKIWHIRVV